MPHISILNPVNVLLDVDGTLASLSTGKHNENLIELLKFFDLTKVSFLTRIAYDSSPSLNNITRKEVSDYLAYQGITVETIYTPFDVDVYKSKPNSENMSAAYPEFMEELETAIIDVKNTPYFTAVDFEGDEEQKKEEIRRRFDQVKLYFNENQVLPMLDGIDEDTHAKLAKMIASRHTYLKKIQPIENTKPQKGDVYQHIQPKYDDVFIFIDDNHTDRTSVENTAQKLPGKCYVFEPPEMPVNGFENTLGTNCYISLTNLLKQISRVRGFPLEINKIPALINFAKSERAANNYADALDLLTLAYALTVEENINSPETIVVIENEMRSIIANNPELVTTSEMIVNEYHLSEAFIFSLDESIKVRSEMNLQAVLTNALDDLKKELLNLETTYLPSAFSDNIKDYGARLFNDKLSKRYDIEFAKVAPAIENIKTLIKKYPGDFDFKEACIAELLATGRKSTSLKLVKDLHEIRATIREINVSKEAQKQL